MNSVLPIQVISAALPSPLQLEEYGSADLKKIIAREPITIFGVGMNVWNRIVGYAYRDVNPMALADLVDARDPLVHEAIARIIGEPVIKEVYYAHGTLVDPQLGYNTVCQILVAQVFPNDLQIGDVLISNPYKPISVDKRKHMFQEYEGFGVLGTVLKNAERVARDRGCDYVTLTAASVDQYHLFSKYKFSVEQNAFSQNCLRIALDGTAVAGGIPMEKKL
jgi:hypothetical protein